MSNTKAASAMVIPNSSRKLQAAYHSL